MLAMILAFVQTGGFSIKEIDGQQWLMHGKDRLALPASKSWKEPNEVITLAGGYSMQLQPDRDSRKGSALILRRNGEILQEFDVNSTARSFLADRKLWKEGEGQRILNVVKENAPIGLTQLIAGNNGRYALGIATIRNPFPSGSPVESMMLLRFEPGPEVKTTFIADLGSGEDRWLYRTPATSRIALISNKVYVHGKDGLYLCDGEKLTKKIAPNAEGEIMIGPAGNKGIVFATPRKHEVRYWTPTGKSRTWTLSRECGPRDDSRLARELNRAVRRLGDRHCQRQEVVHSRPPVF